MTVDWVDEKALEICIALRTKYFFPLPVGFLAAIAQALRSAVAEKEAEVEEALANAAHWNGEHSKKEQEVEELKQMVDRLNVMRTEEYKAARITAEQELSQELADQLTSAQAVNEKLRAALILFTSKIEQEGGINSGLGVHFPLSTFEQAAQALKEIKP